MNPQQIQSLFDLLDTLQSQLNRLSSRVEDFSIDYYPLEHIEQKLTDIEFLLRKKT